MASQKTLRGLLFPNFNEHAFCSDFFNIETPHQFGIWQDVPTRVNEVSSFSLEYKIDSLISIVERFVVGQIQQMKACGISSNMGHPTDKCPILYDDHIRTPTTKDGWINQTSVMEIGHKSSNNNHNDDHNFNISNPLQIKICL